MRTTRPIVLLLLALAVLAPEAQACHRRRCHRKAERYSCAIPGPFYTQTYTPPPAVYAAPQAVMPPSPQTFGYSPASHQGDAGAFLAALNAWRAANARPPLAWDATLAAYAASNAGIHAPGSSGGGSQCWASSASLTDSLRQWIASPAHAALLLNATTSVGASPCPTGSTVNVR